MPRAGLGSEAIIDRAAQMLDHPETDGLSLAALAESFGVRPPSLYKHIDGMPGLQRGVMLRAKSQFAQALAPAAIGRSGDQAIAGIATAYRAWALEHPGQYQLTVRAPVPGDPEDMRASSAILSVVTSVLHGYGLVGDDAVDATRFLRSALHGFIVLEIGGAFELPTDIDGSFERVVGSIVTAVSTWSRRP